MTAQFGSSIAIDKVTAQFGSGIGLTAQGSRGILTEEVTGQFGTGKKSNVTTQLGSGTKKLKKAKKLKEEEFEQGRVLEHGKCSQTPLVAVYNVHSSVSLGIDENLDA